jgi:hypothetical protein
MYPLGTSEEKPTTAAILLQKDKKERRFNEQPPHKTTHLQASTHKPTLQFAKEQFSGRHMQLTTKL